MTMRGSFAWELVMAAYCLQGMVVSVNMVSCVHGVRPSVARELLEHYASFGAVKKSRRVRAGGVVTMYEIPASLAYAKDPRFPVHTVGEQIEKDDYVGGNGLTYSFGSEKNCVAWRKGVFAICRDGKFWTYGDVGLERDIKGALVEEAYRTENCDLLPPRPMTPEEQEHETRMLAEDEEFDKIAGFLDEEEEKEWRAERMQRLYEEEWRRVRVVEESFPDGAQALIDLERIAFHGA